MRKFMPLIFFFVFVLAGYANADTVSCPAGTVLWSGDASFIVKTTSEREDSSGNIKFKTKSERFVGTIQMCIGADGSPVANSVGDYIEILDNTPKVVIGITELASIATDVMKSRSNQFSAVGTGDFIEPGSQATGIAYVDLHGTVKEDSAGNSISIIVSGKTAGGVNTAQGNSVFSANLNSKMLPQ